MKLLLIKIGKSMAHSEEVCFAVDEVLVAASALFPAGAAGDILFISGGSETAPGTDTSTSPKVHAGGYRTSVTVPGQSVSSFIWNGFPYSYFTGSCIPVGEKRSLND